MDEAARQPAHALSREGSGVRPKPTAVRLLGIDPGSRATGWGIVEARGARVCGVAAGVIRLKDDALQHRLAKLYAALERVVETHSPQAVVVEAVFMAKHARSALTLGHARGVALLVAGTRNIPLHSFPPALVKRTVAGHGQAGKEQVARLVGAQLQLKSLPPLDATDALAVALTGARSLAFDARGGLRA